MEKLYACNSAVQGEKGKGVSEVICQAGVGAGTGTEAGTGLFPCRLHCRRAVVLRQINFFGGATWR